MTTTVSLKADILISCARILQYVVKLSMDILSNTINSLTN